MTAVLAAFTHAQGGPDATLALLRGMLLGFFAFALFCASVAVALPEMSTASAFVLATAVALAVQGVVVAAISPSAARHDLT